MNKKNGIGKILDVFWDTSTSNSLSDKFLFISFIDAVGTGLYLACSTIYFSSVLGLSGEKIGISITLASLLGFVAQPMFGRLADRFGSKKVLITLHLWRFIAFFALAFSQNFIEFFLSIVAIGLGQQSLNPIYQAFIEEMVGEQGRVSIMAKVRTIYNVGFSVGGLLTTFALAANSNALVYIIILLCNGISCAIAALLFIKLKSKGSINKSFEKGAPILRFHSLKDGYYMLLSAINGILSFHSSILSIGIPLWILKVNLNPAIAGVLFTVNTVIAILFQVAVSKKANTLKGGIKTLMIGGFSLALSCIVFLLSGVVSHTGTLIMVILGVVLLTVAELFQSAGGWSMSYTLAPLNNRAEYLSAFNMGTSAQSVIGPTIVTIFIVSNNSVGWIGCAIVLIVSAMSVYPITNKTASRMQVIENEIV